MSTTTQPLKFLWQAQFDDEHIIRQSADDHYSKYDETAEWNPSAFRDIVEYSEDHSVTYFVLSNDDASEIYMINLISGKFRINGLDFSLEDEPLTDRKLIYFREMHQQAELGQEVGEPFVNRYAIGYEGKNSKEQIEKKIIYLEG